VFVDGGDGGGADVSRFVSKTISRSFRYPKRRAAEQAGQSAWLEAVRRMSWSARMYGSAGSRFFGHFKGGVILQAGDEENFGHAPTAEQA